MSADIKSRAESGTYRIGAIAAQVAGPALAILAVTSIAWFLIEVTYSGPLVERCKYIFALFCFAAVLISRISIEEGFERAGGYGFLLAFATFLVTARFMQGNLLGLALILAFVWWCAGRLTWDCTFIDDTRDATGQGMIDLAIERVTGDSATSVNSPSAEMPVNGTAPAADSESGWQTVKRIFFRRRQPNTPGLWAFYFLLAGLPLFGLGQLLMPLNDAAAHQAVAGHFFVYITSLLGLLMLSSITGLHRYLGKNNAVVPDRVAWRWVVSGSILAISIAAFAWLLPRPTPGHSLAGLLPHFSTQKFGPSGMSMGQDGQKASDQNKNAGSGPQSRDKDEDAGKTGEAGKSGNQKSGDSGARVDKPGSSEPGGNKAAGKAPGNGKKSGKSPGQGQQSGKSKSSGDQKSGDQKSGDQKSGDQKSGDEKSADKNDSKSSPKGRTTDSRRRGEKKQDPDQAAGNAGQRQSRDNSDRQSAQNQSTASQQSQRPGSNWLNNLGGLLRFLFWCVVLLVIGWFAIRHREKIMPWFHSFLAELAEFWNRLFQRKPRRQPTGDLRPDGATDARQKPGFPRFQNPFANGQANSWSPDEIVRYTFRAFEAWSRDQQCHREPDQTALEFARKTTVRFEGLSDDALNLARLYSQLAYSRADVTRPAAMTLATLWDKLIALYSGPASAQTAV